MESLEDLMDRVMKLMVEVNQKNDLVDEGVRKLENCAQQVLQFRMDQRKIREEKREELEKIRKDRQAKEFRVEQLEEKMRRYEEYEKKSEQEMKNLGELKYKKEQENAAEWEEMDRELLAKRSDLNSRILKTLSGNSSNLQ
ncbi:hypothetical protein L5515_013593 [Caenorhabditis briggsae]|uniref:Uncharacterized protein n=1 Tax=Caenorhabditis briggsae TaxID=6238 RepID=A0AAE9J5L6_CAEBR|nr:hypothetical protein L5515_013593 [Caenorhabditis briggsae]